LGASATACFQAFVDFLVEHGDIRVTWNPVHTWPPLKWIVDRAVVRPGKGRHIEVVTDIGGAGHAEFSEKPSLILHDACHSWHDNGADFTLFSFYPTKLVGGAEGGAMICKTPEIARAIQVLLHSGMAGIGKKPDFTEADPTGRKANMTDVQAALNIEALERLDERKQAVRETWLALRELYLEHGGPLLRLKPQPIQPYLFQVWANDVPQALEAAADEGIGAQWNFPKNPYVTLPCWPGMQEMELERVARLAVRLSR
jgi:hypothetical protein